METTVFEARAKELVHDIKEIVKVKGIDLTDALEEAGISRKSSDRILNKGIMPTLSEFLAMCQISGITFHLPYAETTNSPM
jgi:DNA-binding phage protein